MRAALCIGTRIKLKESNFIWSILPEIGVLEQNSILLYDMKPEHIAVLVKDNKIFNNYRIMQRYISLGSTTRVVLFLDIDLHADWHYSTTSCLTVPSKQCQMKRHEWKVDKALWRELMSTDVGGSSDTVTESRIRLWEPNSG